MVTKHKVTKTSKSVSKKKPVVKKPADPARSLYIINVRMKSPDRGN
jgi:hypothetical protein